MVCALGLGDQLVGITHECDYPPEVKGKPIVVRNALPIERMSQREIDEAVAKRMHDGLSLYEVDEKLLEELAPDLILTQNLCQVCAPSGNEVSQLLNALSRKPQILFYRCTRKIPVDSDFAQLQLLKAFFDHFAADAQQGGRGRLAGFRITAGRTFQ